MKIWKFLMATGAFATTPTESQTTCFTSVVIPGTTNNCEGLYADKGTCKTTCSNGNKVTHTCECTDSSGALLTDCIWKNALDSGDCQVDYLRLDFDVSYTAVGTTNVKTTHEALLNTYFTGIIDSTEGHKITISSFTETVSGSNTDVTCSVEIRFDDAVTTDKWTAIKMYENSATVTADAFTFTTVSTGLDTKLGSDISGTSTISYEKVEAITTDYAGLLRDVDAKETVLETITGLKTQISTLTTDISALETTRNSLQTEVDGLTTDKTTKTTEKTTKTTEKTTKQGELTTATTKVTDKQAEIDVVKGDITDINTATATVEADITTLEADLATKQATLATLEDVKTAKDVTITLLTGKITDQDTSISGLNSEITTKTGTKSDKADELDTVQGAYSDSETKKTGLEADKTAAQTKLDDKTDEVTAAKALFEENKTKIATNTATTEGMEAEIESMKKKFKLFVLSG